MKRLVTLWIMLLGLIGCLPAAFPGHYTHHPESWTGREIDVQIIGMDDEDWKSIVEAVNAWNYALNGQIVIRVVSGANGNVLWKGGWVIMPISRDNPSIQAMDADGEYTLGRVDVIGGNIIWIVRDQIYFTPGMVYGVAMHEMGHLLGAQHEAKGLMEPEYDDNAYKCVDWSTMRQVSEWEGFRMSDVNWCGDKPG